MLIMSAGRYTHWLTGVEIGNGKGTTRHRETHAPGIDTPQHDTHARIAAVGEGWAKGGLYGEGKARNGWEGKL